MKHRILIEFESSKLPADFTDIVLNRIYMLDCVDKKECTATLVGDVPKDSERLKQIAWLIGSIYVHSGFKAETQNEVELEKLLRENGTFWESLSDFDAAKDTQ